MVYALAPLLQALLEDRLTLGRADKFDPVGSYRGNSEAPFLRFLPLFAIDLIVGNLTGVPVNLGLKENPSDS